MKIIQINAVNRFGSTGSLVNEIHQYLLARGHESYIAFSKGNIEYNNYKIGNELDVKIHSFLSRFFGKQAYFSNIATFKLIEWMKRINPDVVHLHNLHSNYINLKLLTEYLSKNNIATVISLHDCWFYTGKCTHYTVDNCFKWKENCGNCPRLKKDNKSWFFDHTPQMLNDKESWFKNIPRLAVIGVSKWITNEAQHSILSSADLIKTVYNWIDMDKFKPINDNYFRKKFGLEDKYILLGVSSRWSKSKGMDKFIELSNYIEDNEVIVLVGELPAGKRLPKNVIHIPRTEDVDELVKIYSTADVFLNFSLEESFGKVTAEALACNTPVISNNWTANPELVSKDCGIVLNDLGIENVIMAIKKIRGRFNNTQINTCRTFAENNFDKFKKISQIESIYKEVYFFKENL